MDLGRRMEVFIRKLRDAGIDFSDTELKLIKRGFELLGDALEIIDDGFVPGHDVEHMIRVAEIAIYLQRKHGGDFAKILLASLLHDVMRHQKNHAYESARFAREFLKKTEFKHIADDVAKIIEEHSYSTHSEPSSLESMILRDADRLDALGAIGVARVFSYSAHLGRELYDPQNPTRGGALAHFFEKILRLPEMMHTGTAKKVAKKRAEFVRTFIDSFLDELTLRDLEETRDEA